MSEKQTKKCSKCGEIKTLSEFHKSKRESCGYKSRCKMCRHEYTVENREYLSKYHKEYREKNKEMVSKRKSECYKKKAEYYKRKVKKYREENLEACKNRNRDYHKKRIKEDLNYKLTCHLRSTVNNRIKKNGGKKSYKTMDLLGCTIEEARKHIESQFQEGMTWENHGIDGWHIDHIRPCSSFDLTDPEQQKKCFNYKNLQPLWAEDNLSKSDKWDKTEENR